MKVIKENSLSYLGSERVNNVHRLEEHCDSFPIIAFFLQINDKEFPLSDTEEGSENDLSIQNQV